MSATVDVTQKSVLDALRSFILSLIDCEVIQGLGNGVAMPKLAFIAMTVTGRKRLSTNTDKYIGQTKATKQNTQLSVQIDCYGKNSGDWAQILSTMLRDEYGCIALGENVQPLYNGDPMMIPLTTGENTYLERWMIPAVLQYNPVISFPQQSAIELAAELIEIDSTFPPQGN